MKNAGLIVGILAALIGAALRNGNIQVKIGPVASVIGSGKIDIKDESKQIINPDRPSSIAEQPIETSSMKQLPDESRRVDSPDESTMTNAVPVEREAERSSARKGDRSRLQPQAYYSRFASQPYYPQTTYRPAVSYNQHAVTSYQPPSRFSTARPATYYAPTYRVQPVQTYYQTTPSVYYQTTPRVSVSQGTGGQTIQSGGSLVIQSASGQYIRSGGTEVIQTRSGQTIRAGNVFVSQRR
jgi:hypothetical protein